MKRVTLPLNDARIKISLESKLIQFLSKCHQTETLLLFTGQRLEGTKSLFDKGIKICPYCQKFLPTENQFCKCGERVFCDYINPLEFKVNQITGRTINPNIKRIKQNEKRRNSKFVDAKK